MKSEVFVADGQELMMIMGCDLELLRVMWRVIQRNESIAFEWLVNCGRRDATARVVHLLLETAVRSGVNVGLQPLVIPFTQEQIAQITGQTTVNVNRVFADLQESRLIGRRGREITFRHPDELWRLSDFDPEYLLLAAE